MGVSIIRRTFGPIQDRVPSNPVTIQLLGKRIPWRSDMFVVSVIGAWVLLDLILVYGFHCIVSARDW